MRICPVPEPSPHVVEVPTAPPAADVAHDISSEDVPATDDAVVDVALAVQAPIDV